MPVTKVFRAHAKYNLKCYERNGWKMLNNIKQNNSIKYFRLQFDSPLLF